MSEKVKTKKPLYKRWWFIVLAAIFIIGTFGGDDEETGVAEEDDTEVVEEVEAETPEVDEEPEVAEEPVKEGPTEEEMREMELTENEWRTDITWENMMRNPEEYAYLPIEIHGEVQSIQEDETHTYIQLMMDGDVNQPVIVKIESRWLESRLLGGDLIKTNGTFTDLTEYETVLGASVTAPIVQSDFVFIQ